MSNFLDFLISKKILISIVIITIILIITLGLIFGIRKIETCDLPKCDPCIYSKPTEWTNCNSSRQQYRKIYNDGYKKTNMNYEDLAIICKDKQEKRTCEYFNTYILFHDKCELDSIVHQGEISTEFPELIIPDEKNIQKITLPSYIILNKIGKIELYSDSNEKLTITDTPYCIPSNFKLKKVKLINK